MTAASADPGDPAQLRRELAAQVGRGCPQADPAWQEAVATVPREVFLGPAVFRPEGARWKPLHRAELGETEWLRLSYSDTTWVVQVDGLDAADAREPLTGTPSSSSTLPSLVVRTLQAAQLRDGQRVLEIGTGTGYSTAVMSDRLGGDNVWSVEYDAGLARRAAERLRSAGYSPTVVTGDGLQGHSPAADYDALVATCAVRHIPRSWLWQVRAGGTVTVTLSGWMLASGLVRLTLGDDSTASGRFLGDPVSYMLARPHQPPPRHVFYRRPGDTRPSRVSPGSLESWTGRFVAQLAAPSAELLDSTDGPVLLDVATGSQAWLEPAGSGGSGDWTVHQSGPLRLWDRVEESLVGWQAAGEPGQSAFGMTVGEDVQRVWLGDPGGMSWRLPN